MTTYTHADDDTMRMLKEVADEYHAVLGEEGVTVSILMAHAAIGDDGDPKGPALKHHGVPAFATIRRTTLKQRVAGMADAEMTIDGDRWPHMPVAQRRAIIDHELTHLDLVIKEDGLERDDHGRPKLRLRPHDVEVGWFYEVAERHGDDSQERQQARAIAMDQHGQVLFSFVEQPEECAA
jgi:hypothetical protein